MNDTAVTENERYGSHGEGLSDIAQYDASAGGAYQPAGGHLLYPESDLGGGEGNVVEQGKYQQQHSGSCEYPQHVPVDNVLEGKGEGGACTVVYLLERYQVVFGADAGHIQRVALLQDIKYLAGNGVDIGSRHDFI